MWRKSDRNIRVWIIIGFLFLLLIASVDAGKEIVVDPHAITFNSTAGNMVTRTVVVSATDNLTGLMFVANDLLEKSGTKIIPQQAILISPITSQMNNNSIQQIPIRFDLADVSGGLYTGEVWLASSSNGIVKIPVTATIKDDLIWPILILLVGILVSFLLFNYGSRMKRRDEIQRALNVIEDRFKSDTRLKMLIQYDRNDRVSPERINPYYEQIRYHSETVQEKLEIGTTTDADTPLKKLQTDWDTWNISRGRLIGLFERFSKLINELNSLEQQILNDGKPLVDTSNPETVRTLNSGTVISINKVRYDLQQKFDAVLEDAGQKGLEGELNNGINWINVLIRIVNSLIELENLCREKNQLSNAECQKCHWDSLKSYNLERIEEFDAGVKKQLEKVKQLPELSKKVIERVVEEEEESRQSLRYLEFRELPLIESIHRSRWAEVRLTIYDSGSFLITVIIIALIGFSQLYLSNPTFGASIEDYATLGLWGLLAGSTAQAISQKIQGAVVMS